LAARREWLLFDADVLIDYALADASILGLAARHLGSVPLWWGLELMLALVRVGELEAGDAVAVAAAIRAGNPRHITADILERFAREVARGGATRGPAR
jgi:hypothetical protein